MALPINIEDLLNKRKVEGNRIEFKKGWNQIGIPTIQEEMQKNGSPRATIETNDERNFINVFIPVHEGCGDMVMLNDTENVTKDVTKDVTKELTERQRIILKIIQNNPFVTIPEMSLKTRAVTRTIKRDIETLQKAGILIREGGRKEGKWVIIAKL